MITTGCEGCCFLKKKDEDKVCALLQVVDIKDGQAFTPGYCRLCRSHNWAKKQNTTDLQSLYKKVMEERVLKFDMLVFFDEEINTIEDLETTLNSDWYIKYAKKIIIMDVTGFGERNNLALQYLKSRKHIIPTVVDSSVTSESKHQREETIRRVSKQVTAPFFLVISAGNNLNNFDMFAEMIQHIPSRVIHWSFPFTLGTTAIVPNNLHCGLFITVPYRSLMRFPETESFTEQLRKEEIETKMGLSWLSTEIWLA